MKTLVRLDVRCNSSTASRSLSSVLAPDNEGTPRGLELCMKDVGQTIEFSISAGSPSTAISTALAVLRDVTLFQEVWLLSRGRDARVQGA